MTVPPRIGWAVDLLDVSPDDEILEVGCGPGVAASLVCAELDAGRITAIDRSATSIARASARNAACVAGGRAVFRHVDLAGFGGRRDSFDKAFAVNVNVFWTGEAEAECEVLQRVLRPGGVVRLVYDAGPSGRARDLGELIGPKLKRHGFSRRVTHHSTQGMACATGRLRQRA
jgi:SAM-dependent methyltransferase